MAKIETIEVGFPTTIRKYRVDTDGLRDVLREGRQASGLNNKQISEILDRPYTLVEHWFRRGKGFGIPGPDVWPRLKELLGIQTDRFDESIMTFEVVPGEYDQRNRIYLTNGIMPTLTTGGQLTIMEQPKIERLGGLWGDRQAGAVFNKTGLSPTLKTPSGGYSEPMIIEDEPRGDSSSYRVEPLKTNDLFCGGGGMGLGFLQAGYHIAGAWDFDKFAVESYRHNVGDHVQLKDIREMTSEDMPRADVWTFGFPCQDLSIAGRKAGLFEGKKSGLFFEVMRLLQEVRENRPEDMPKIILAENVKGLSKYLETLESEYEKAGYKMYYKLFNSKFWGVPQSRERYFVVGVHESIEKTFFFPEQQEYFVPRLSTILEDEVEEKYYISPEKTKVIIDQVIEKVPLEEVQACLTTEREFTRQRGRRAKENEQVSFTLTAQDQHGVVIRVREATKKGYAEAVGGDSINISHPNSKTRRGRVGKQVAQTLIPNNEQVAVINHRIRKLTPREYARLQGFPDSYEVIVSNRQAYKQFGNAVTVNVARALADRIKVFLQSL